MVQLFFVDIEYPWWALDGRLFKKLAGSPNHIDIGVGGLVYTIGPGRGGCCQFPLDAYLSASIPRYRRVATAAFPTPDERLPEVVAMQVAVGPMTRRRALLRALTGKQSYLDMDCVAAATMVVNATGHLMQCPRTPKEMLHWLIRARLGQVTIYPATRSPS